MKQERETLIAKNKSLADYNYQREPTYNELRKVLEDAHKQAVQLKQGLLEKQAKLDRLKPKLTPDTLRGLLQVAAQESEEKSEEIAKEYLASEKSFEEFIKEFIKKRTEYHVRRIKYEKLIDSIQHPNQSNQNSSGPMPSSAFNSLPNQSNHHSNHLPGASLPHHQPPYPPSNAPFAYQPFNSSVQPIRSAPLPPNLPVELPPYPYGPPPINQYPPAQQPNSMPSFPFNLNQPNYR